MDLGQVESSLRAFIQNNVDDMVGEAVARAIANTPVATDCSGALSKDDVERVVKDMDLTPQFKELLEQHKSYVGELCAESMDTDNIVQEVRDGLDLTYDIEQAIERENLPSSDDINDLITEAINNEGYVTESDLSSRCDGMMTLDDLMGYIKSPCDDFRAAIGRLVMMVLKDQINKDPASIVSLIADAADGKAGLGDKIYSQPTIEQATKLNEAAVLIDSANLTSVTTTDGVVHNKPDGYAKDCTCDCCVEWRDIVLRASTEQPAIVLTDQLHKVKLHKPSQITSPGANPVWEVNSSTHLPESFKSKVPNWMPVAENESAKATKAAKGIKDNMAKFLEANRELLEIKEMMGVD